MWRLSIVVAVGMAGGCGRLRFDPIGVAGDAATVDAPWPTLGGRWTWMAGSSAVNQAGSYGTRGVPAAINHPGSRDNGGAWVSGDALWMFGGYGFGASGSQVLSDLWRFDPATGMWTWMSGPTSVASAGTYGTKGVPSAANVPGARNDAMSWVDGAGDLWIFGGSGRDGAATNGSLDDVWRYHIPDGTWTWWSGTAAANQPGVYGTLGVGSTSNVPGGRSSAQLWASSTEVWLLGGAGIDRSGTSGRLADLWRFDPATTVWTWMAGPDLVGQAAVHGTLGVPDPANTPGDRQAGCTFTAVDELWLFGGSNMDGRRSDVWRYTISSGLWTWMAGPSAPSLPGIYGTRGVSDPAATPGARVSHVCWQDPLGNFWVFGGYGTDSAGTVGSLNDLWVFTPSTTTWTWVTGSDLANQIGSWGSPGVADPANTPGARLIGGQWSAGDGSLWLFGGDSARDASGAPGSMADLWRFAHP